MSSAFVLIHSLGWTLLHSLWQGALICSGTALLAVLFRKNTNARYYSAYVSLMTLLVCFVVTLILEYQRMQVPLVKVTETSAADTYREYYVKAANYGQEAINLPVMQQLETWFPYIIPAYLVGILLLSVRFLFQLGYLRTYRTKQVSQPPEELSLMFGALQRQLAMQRKTLLLLSGKVKVPVTFGFLKPVVLLPIAAASHLSTDQLEAILLHELAHIRRNDYLLHLLQTVAETILFFNPFAWVLSRMVHKESEHCCDDLVVQHTGNPLHYARALASVAGISLQEHRLAMAASGRSGQLFHRIKRIMNMEKKPSAYNHAFSVLLFAVAVTAAVLIIVPAIAQSKKKEKTTTQQPQNDERKTQQTTITREEIYTDNDDDRPDEHDVPEPPAPATAIAPVTPVAPSAPVAPESPEAPEAPEPPVMPDIEHIVSDALASVDWEAIDKDVTVALKNVDWKQIDRDIDNALREAERELHDPKQRAELRRELRKAREAVRKASEERLEVSAAQRDAMRHGREAALAGRRAALEAARAEQEAQRKSVVVVNSRLGDKTYKAARTEPLIEAMHRDGLINKNGNYTIVRSGNSLIVNGQPAEESTLNKYRRYFSGEHVIIENRNNKREVISSN